MRIKKTSKRAQIRNFLVVLAAFATGKAWCADSTNSPAGMDPLLDLFIKKGYVTQQEAEQVQAEADASRTNNAGYSGMSPKWSIVPGIKGMELYGDVRMRFENREAVDPNGGSIGLNRLRYSLRFGVRGDAFDNFYYGVRIETAANPRSPWVTLSSSTTTGNSGSSPYQGPFGKSTDGIGVGQVYLGWKLQDWLNITIGKMPNYLYTTPMVWDNDLNPEGAFERLNYTVGEADFFGTFGQFLYQDTNPTSAANGYFNPLAVDMSSLPFMMAWQLGVNYHTTKTTNLKIAPVIYNYFGVKNEGTPQGGGVGPDFSGTFVGQGTGTGLNGIPASYNLAPPGVAGFDGFYSNQTGLNDLLVLDVPAEFDIKLSRMNVRIFGDYAYNLEGSKRAQAAFNAQSSTYWAAVGGGTSQLTPIPSAQTGDVHAYQIGFGFGSRDLDYGPEQGLVYGTSSEKHGWEFRAYWQHVEQYALDPNLIDSDFFEGRGNMQGFYVALSYALSQNVLATVRYGNAQRINDKLGTGGSNQDIPQMNPIDHYHVVQVDATLRF